MRYKNKMLKLINRELKRTKSILSEAVLSGFQIYFLYPKPAEDKACANHLQILNFEEADSLQTLRG